MNLTLQFIIGSGDRDHQKEIMKCSDEWLEKPDHEVFFLVPNYNKFDREKEILSALKQNAKKDEFSTVRAQVYSFHRLSWYFLQRVGKLKQQVVDDVGSAMIMRKSLIQCKDQLVFFRGEIEFSGFIQQLLELYQEFKTGNISFQVFEKKSEVSLSEQQMLRKIEELQLIFKHYESELLNHELDIAQPLVELTNYLLEENELNLKNTLFIIDGFSTFNAQEQMLILALMKKSHVVIDLMIDFPEQEPNTLDLFYEGKNTYQKIKNLAIMNKVPIYFDRKAPVLQVLSAGYLEVEQFWRENKKETTNNKFLNIWKFVTPEEEVRQIAVEIRHLIFSSQKTKNPLYYRDIQLLTLTPEVYYPLIPAIFKECDIPFYMDEQRRMEQHPLLEMVQSLFSLDRYYYRLNDIMRFLRTELYLPIDWEDEKTEEERVLSFRDLVDRTENQALAHKYEGQDWLSKEDWILVLGDSKNEEMKLLQEQTNQIRRYFQRDVFGFFQEIKQSKTNREAAAIFYKFLVTNGIERQLLEWRDREIQEGQIEQARNHEQTWSSLMHVLDQFVTIYGEESFDIKLFEEILVAGIKNQTFGKIPMAIDQVQINPLDLSRPLQKKVTFAIGLDEMTFPRKTQNQTLLSKEERDWLNEQLDENQFIQNKVEETFRKEPFVAYNMLLSASYQLYLSYATNHLQDSSVGPSSYILRLVQNKIGDFEERHAVGLTDLPDAYVATYRGAIRELNLMARLAQDEKQSLGIAWRQLKKVVLNSSKSDFAQRVFASQIAKNNPVSLKQEIALKLYGENIFSSVSQMETFSLCEYRYFANYGLKLREREVYGLNPIVTGDFFHEALDRFLSKLYDNGRELIELNSEERKQILDELLMEMFGEPHFYLFSRTARMQFIYHRLSQAIDKMTWAMKEHSCRTKLTPKRTEVLFGQLAGKQGIPGLNLPLKSGGLLKVRGKIDRVDVVTSQGKTWLSVIDYKSSERSFDLNEFYYGMAMQLVTYLDVAINEVTQIINQNPIEVQPAGAYYMHVHQPILDGEQTEEEQLKAYKYDGLFIKDRQLFPLYDDTIVKSKNSLLFPIRRNKDEQLEYVKQSEQKFFTQEEVKLLRNYNRKNMQKNANKIQDGSILLNPTYQTKNKQRACQTCPFRSICQFDPMLEENNYHRIIPHSKEELLNEMKGKNQSDE